jgi:filamentous hemagglutinin
MVSGRKRYIFYLDKTHDNHLKVFNKQGEFKKVLNLDGTKNAAKTRGGEGRTIDT